jgi:hypothetical protein
MATYEEIHGKRVETFSSDPTLDSSYEGQVWFNSTSGTLKSVVASATWSSSTSMTTARTDMGGFGIQTAAVACAGFSTPPPTRYNITEEYNGTGWSNSGNMNTTRAYLAGAGTLTAGIAMGGETPSSPASNATETYNGTSWTNAPNMVSGRYNLAGAGTTSAALAMNGRLGSPPSIQNLVEEYNGSSWTAVTATPYTTSSNSGIGLQTAALNIGGEPSFRNNVLAYDGTNWTASPTLNLGRDEMGASGVSTAAIVFAGNSSPGLTTQTEQYDGTSWSETADMATARRYLGSAMAAPNTTSLGFGGGTPTTTGVTEEFNTSINTVTAAAFSSGGSMGNARYGGNYFGTGKSSQVAVGGQKAAVPPTANNIADSETYDGTTWSEGNNLGTVRFNASGTGTETAGLVATGRNPAASPSPQVYYGNTEEYDGTSYSEVNDCPQAAYRRCGAGTQTATIIVGGLVPPSGYSTTSNEYDGTNWSSGGAAPFQANYMDGVGVTTAAVVFGGQQDPATRLASYDYDGTSWTANNNMNIDHGGQHLVAGTVTDAIIAGGGAPYAVAAKAETYDGTTFTTNATLGQAGQRGGKGSTTANAIGCGGYAPGYLTATEEYTVASTAVNAKTLTTS